MKKPSIGKLKPFPWGKFSFKDRFSIKANADMKSENQEGEKEIVKHLDFKHVTKIRECPLFKQWLMDDGTIHTQIKRLPNGHRANNPESKEILQIIANQDLIAAVKVVRQKYGLGLAEAADWLKARKMWTTDFGEWKDNPWYQMSREFERYGNK